MFNMKRLAKYLATGVMPEMTALDESLAEHDKKYHPEGYKEGDRCNKRETMKAIDRVDSIYAFADTDTSLYKPSDEDVRDDSIVIVAGDVDAQHLKQMCKNNPNKTFLAIHGNHRMFSSIRLPNFKMLADDVIEIGGLKVFGLDYVPRWTNRDARYDANEFEKIPDNLDVLITHMPPHVEGSDIDASQWNGKTSHLGSVELTEAIKRKRPRVVLCGHIHGGSKEAVKIGDSTVYNCALYEGDSSDYKGTRVKL